MGVRYSLISPTFGRPDEVQEFLQSLTFQDYPSFEVIIADGTPKQSLESVVMAFSQALKLQFIYEEFLPVSDARNRAAAAAQGEYIIFLDSDCIIPANYLKKIDASLAQHGWDAFGGPDAAHSSFTPIQKAISYSMTSLYTTGGIRGKKTHVGQFHPRGFNMGMKKTVFEAVGGYSDFKCGEDIELSIRIIKAGYKVGLITEAFVYHKRRTDFQKFFKQVFRFGAARINIHHRHPEELKLAHLFPFLFICYLASFLVIWAFPKLYFLWVSSLITYVLAIFIDATLKNGSVYVGILAVRAAFTQLTGYGWGFAKNAWEVWIKRNPQGLKL